MRSEANVGEQRALPGQRIVLPEFEFSVAYH